MTGLAVANIDKAGGTIKPGSNATVFYKGQPIAVVGSPVEPHGSSPHNGASMIQGSAKVFIKGIPVCMGGSRASCDHVATGRPDLTSSV